MGNKLKIEELITRIFKTSYQLLAQPQITTLLQKLELMVTEIVTPPLLLPLLAQAAVHPLQTNNILELPLKVLQLISLTSKPLLRSRRMKTTKIVMRRRKKKSDTFKSSNYNKYLR